MKKKLLFTVLLVAIISTLMLYALSFILTTGKPFKIYLKSKASNPKEVYSYMKCPIYQIGGNFKGLDLSQMNSSQHKYVFQGNISAEQYKPNSVGYIIKYDSAPAIYKCLDPYYLRATTSDGRTLWKSSNLSTLVEELDPDSKPLKNVEYLTQPCAYLNHGVVLYDLIKKSYVIKKNDGFELQMPTEISKYKILQNVDGNMNRNFFFGQYGTDKNFEVAVVGHNGNLISQCKTKIRMLEPSYLHVTPDFKRMVIKYDDPSLTARFIVISTDGKLIKNYPHLNLENGIAFDTNTPDYAWFRIINTKGIEPFVQNVKYILDIRSGNIVAGLDYMDKEPVNKAKINREVIYSPGQSIDMTQVNNKLIAVTTDRNSLMALDVLAGKLIQRIPLADSIRINDNGLPSVRISKDAKEIWLVEPQGDKTNRYYYFRSLQ